MNDGGMKQGQRFIALRRMEYVWLSAVWWKQPGLSDGHMERNLLNDSIPPEMSQEEGFYLCLSHSGLLSDIGRCVLEYEWKGCDKKCRLRNIGLLLHIWHACLMFKITKERQPFSFQLWWVILAFRFQLWVTAFTPILLSQRFLTRGDKTLTCHQQTELDQAHFVFVYTHKPLKRCDSNCQSEMPQFIFCYTVILSKLWFSYNTHWHLWVPQTVSI